jgi:hypothetical protein
MQNTGGTRISALLSPSRGPLPLFKSSRRVIGFSQGIDVAYDLKP